LRELHHDCQHHVFTDGSELDTDTVVEDVPVKTAKATMKTGGASLEKRLEAVGLFKYRLRIAEQFSDDRWYAC
jgi:uncharacterized Zn ribbon protein